ncbi:helix-turn-helix domain-containing protein [Rhizomonospora bruguierae]|uniref:helix-turn-helix domain-containing protein n=1 Tax=Rhizomonospora bruguierae TaxID=1581705 RepID=UPI001BCCC1EA|nr:helix-turn-helix transcriptional regulator [Micromonospora sp. NBRC 107566]
MTSAAERWQPRGVGRLSDEMRAVLRSERERTGLSQVRLARRAGVSASLVSRIESGRVRPTIAQAERLLAALNRQLVLATEPLGADLDAEFDAVASLSLADRLAPLLEPGVYHDLAVLLPAVVEGPLAALIQGVPLPVAGLDLVIEHGSAAALAEWLKRRGAQRWHPRWREFRLLPFDPLAPLPPRYRIGFVELRVRLCERLPEALEVRVPPRRGVADAVIRVLPLAEVELADPHCARMLRRYRERQGG